MMTNKLCYPVTIFEGPDGCGKTTAAKMFASRTDAEYVHFGPLPKVDKGLARVYVETMIPALLSHRPVVLDRCWLSEMPYGEVFRHGQDRLGLPTCRMLERLAMRCGAVVVKCLPSVETCVKNFNSRRELEYLDGEASLKSVYDLYNHCMETSLPVVDFDYTKRDVHSPQGMFNLLSDVSQKRTPYHHVDLRTAGNLDARVMLVGDEFGNMGEHDAFYQWPFASTDHGGCSQWLTKQLESEGIGEQDLCWINADALGAIPPFAYPRLFSGKSVIALGHKAFSVLQPLGLGDLHQVEHPQYWKRFHASDRYPLLDVLKEVTNAVKL